MESPATVRVPADAREGLAWIQLAFDDSAWVVGDAAVGYDENDTDSTEAPRAALLSGVPSPTMGGPG